jgi:hypothetical protein
MPSNLTPCRSWSSPSYDASNGRAASSLDNANENAISIEQETIRPSRQLPRRNTSGGGAETLAQHDARCTQGGTNIKNRPIG